MYYSTDPAGREGFLRVVMAPAETGGFRQKLLDKSRGGDRIH